MRDPVRWHGGRGRCCAPTRISRWTRAASSAAVFESPAGISGLDDVAVVRQPIEHGGCHFGVAENLRPIGKGEIGGDQQRRVLIELADQVEQQLAASLAERQVAEFVDDDEIIAQQLLGQAAASAGGLLLLELVDQIDQIEESSSSPGADDRRGDSDAQMGFSGAGRSSDILPGIRTSREESTIGSIRALVRWSFLYGIIAFRVRRSLSSSRAMALWRTYLAG